MSFRRVKEFKFVFHRVLAVVLEILFRFAYDISLATDYILKGRQ